MPTSPPDPIRDAPGVLAGTASDTEGAEADTSAAERHFADVCMTHHDLADLLGALRAYAQVIAAHPDTPEAEHSRARIQSIMALGVRLPDGTVVLVERLLAHRWRWPG